MPRSLNLLLLSCIVASCATPHLGDKELPPAPPSLRAAFEAMPAPAVGAVRLLPENADSWLVRYRALSEAKSSIDVQYFIVEPDVYGLTLLSLMAEKARAGVKVRFLLDARGSIALIRGSDRFMLQEVQRAGVDAKVYNPIIFNVADTIGRGDLRAVTASNHDKLVLVDGDLGVAGGRNLSRDYMANSFDHHKAFIDLDILVRGPEATARLTEAFVPEHSAKKSTAVFIEPGTDGALALRLVGRAMRMWLLDKEVGKAPPDPAERSLRLQGQASVDEPTLTAEARDVLRRVADELVLLPHLRGALRTPPSLEPAGAPVELRVLDTWSTESTVPKNTVNENLLASLQAAREDVVLQSPYFILTPRGLRAFEEASARGVKITILTNSPASSDSPITQAAFLKQWPELLARAPTARLFVTATPRLMHAKAGVMDRVLTFVGSYNLDPLSAGVNGEVVSAVWDEVTGHNLASVIEAWIAKGTPEVVEYRIKKDDAGHAVRDADGKAIVVFGPDDHCDAEKLQSVRRLEPALELLAPIL